MSVGVSPLDWSGRHTRLRYQSVLSALLFALVVEYGIEAVNVPGFLKLKDTPPKGMVLTGLLAFGLYSLVSFVYQHTTELRARAFARKDIKNLPKALLEKYGWSSGNGSEFDILKKCFGPSARADGTVKGKQAINGGTEIEYVEAYSVLQTYRKLHASGDDLVFGLQTMLPSRFSEAAAFVYAYKLFSSEFDDLLSKLRALDRRIWNSEPIPTSDLREIMKLLDHVESYIPHNTGEITGLEAEISNYLRNHWVQTSLLPFMIPTLLSGALLIIGGYRWLT